MNNPLYIKEADVQQHAPVHDVITALEQAFRDQAAGRAFNNPRTRLRMPGSTLHMMAGAIPGYFGYKAYTSAATGTNFLFYLFQAGTTDLLAIMEADALGQIRTGAVTGGGGGGESGRIRSNSVWRWLASAVATACHGRRVASETRADRESQG